MVAPPVPPLRRFDAAGGVLILGMARNNGYVFMVVWEAVGPPPVPFPFLIYRSNGKVKQVGKSCR
jgi:hypothetical protein